MMEWSASRSRWTRLAYAFGSLGAAVCLAIAIGVRVLGAPLGGDGPVPGAGLPQGLVELRAAAWATLGVLILLATPPLGLLATALELRRASPAVAGLALAVLAVLAASLALALW